MTNSFLRYVILIILAAVAAGPALAADSCSTDYELIFRLRDPQEGSYNIWDAVYGKQDAQERFKTGFIPESGDVIAAGERFKFKDGPFSLVVAEFDSRGRTHWEHEKDIPGLRAVIKMLPAKGGFLVLGNKEIKKKQTVWIGFFTPDGLMKSEQNIGDAKGALAAHDIIPARDGKGFVLATSFESSGSDKARYARIYKLDEKGRAQSDRSYNPGPANKILGLGPVGTDEYITTGWMAGEDGRQTGWAMRLDRDGNIVWQRQYPRGRSAALVASKEYLTKYILVAGDAEPAGKGDTAGWLMVIDAGSGEIGWQRYFSGSYVYHARDVLASRDGLISVLVQGDLPATDEKNKEPSSPASQAHARLLTLNPRGALFISDEFFNGEGAQGEQMIMGQSEERIIIGSTNMAYQVEGPQQGPGLVLHSLDGWVLAATAMEPYEDECLEPGNFAP